MTDRITVWAATHRRPDLDAAAGVWLWRSYVAPLLHGDDVAVEVEFVPAGQAPAGDVDAVIDTGGVCDPAGGRFDHHTPDLGGDRAVSATALVYRRALDLGAPVDHLEPLVALVTEGDHGGAAWSRQVGLHAMVQALLAAEADDGDVIDAIGRWLDLVDHTLAAQARARAEVASATVWRAPDGSVAAILDGSPDTTRAAFELHDELRLVVWLNRQPTTVSVGCRRREGLPWAVGDVLDGVADRLTADAELAGEVARWFRHGSGVFAMRGTAKNPDQTPLDEAAFLRLAQVLWEGLRRVAG